MTKSFKTRWVLATAAGALLLAAACSSGGGTAQEPTEVPTEAPPATIQPAAQATTLPPITSASVNLSPDRIQLAKNSSTRYYDVRGLTTSEIFDSIDKNGPRDDKGVKGSGLTAATWGYRWQPQIVPEGCIIASMTVSLDIVVTLPKHQQESSLSAGLARNWDAFEASVAKHEQTHVDIDQAGANAIRDKMVAIKSGSNCDQLARQVDAVWTSEQKAIEDAQGQFHAQEDVRIAALRAPLQAQIDVNRPRIVTLKNQIDALDASLATTNTELNNINSQLKALEDHINQILAAYPGGNLPADVFTQYEEYRRLYNALAPNFNQLVSQYNSSIAQRNQVADEHDKLVDATNLLVDQFNWTR